MTQLLDTGETHILDERGIYLSAVHIWLGQSIYRELRNLFHPQWPPRSILLTRYQRYRSGFLERDGGGSEEPVRAISTIDPDRKLKLDGLLLIRFWREWMDKNDKDYWGKFDEKDA
jgi:hypothetical protein